MIFATLGNGGQGGGDSEAAGVPATGVAKQAFELGTVKVVADETIRPFVVLNSIFVPAGSTLSRESRIVKSASTAVLGTSGWTAELQTASFISVTEDVITGAEPEKTMVPFPRTWMLFNRPQEPGAPPPTIASLQLT
ncbi:MAG: hypothetical protein ACK45Y_07825, partial [Betaproteobacteria bacterium]